MTSTVQRPQFGGHRRHSPLLRIGTGLAAVGLAAGLVTVLAGPPGPADTGPPAAGAATLRESATGVGDGRGTDSAAARKIAELSAPTIGDRKTNSPGSDAPGQDRQGEDDSLNGRELNAPCDESATVCVQLSTAHWWLVQDGGVVRDGFISAGGEGEETPTGEFTVQWKNYDHVSGESGVPMPYSVFFDGDGHALHEGSLDTGSAGCVRLEREDAAAVFWTVRPGDVVEILP